MVADVMIAINPGEEINDLYSKTTMTKYLRSDKNKLPPHIFSLGSLMFTFTKKLVLSNLKINIFQKETT